MLLNKKQNHIFIEVERYLGEWCFMLLKNFEEKLMKEIKNFITEGDMFFDECFLDLYEDGNPEGNLSEEQIKVLKLYLKNIIEKI